MWQIQHLERFKYLETTIISEKVYVRVRKHVSMLDPLNIVLSITKEHGQYLFKDQDFDLIAGLR